MRRRQLWILLTFLILVALVAATLQGGLGRPKGIRAVDMPELVADVERHEVVAITIQGPSITAELKDGTKISTIGPEQPDYYIGWFTQNGVVPRYERSQGAWLEVAGLVAPTVVLGLVMALLFRQMQVGNNRAINFGRSRPRLAMERSRKVTFADVAGCEEAKEELKEIVLFLKDPHRFGRLGGRIPKGVLLMGSPGSGKTLLARAVAGEAGVPFFSISGSEFIEMFVGVGASRVRDLFEQARRRSPCIVFIDEIDAIGRHRGGHAATGTDERDQTLNQLLVEMDGFESSDALVLIAATNRPDVLDPALLRPGRFDRRVIVPAPDVRGRQEILRVHGRKVALAPEVDLERLARSTPGFSGADLANVMNEAALLAARAEKPTVTQADLETAKDKVAMGAERRSLVVSPEERRRTAFHEAGHAVVARLVPDCDPVDKITIVPRGFALGLTQPLPRERHAESAAYRLGMLALLMGGRAAEEEVYGERWSGAEADLRNATRLARHMVCVSGMSDALGPVAWGTPVEDATGRSRFEAEYSPATAERIDAEVRRLLDEAHAQARELLRENRGLLDAVAAALLDRETLDSAAFEAIVRDHLAPSGA